MPDSTTLRHSVFPDSVIEQLCAMGQTRAFPKNAVVVVEGESAESLYIVLEGRLRVYVSDEDGNEAELTQLGPREYFGELMIGSTVRTASVRTLEPSKLSMVSREDFEFFIRGHSDAAFNLIQSLVHRIAVLTETVQSLSLLDVYGRVVRIFQQAAAEDESGVRFVPGLSQQKLAERVGASKSMINRILKDLAEGGYITVTRERIELHKELPKKW